MADEQKSTVVSGQFRKRSLLLSKKNLILLLCIILLAVLGGVGYMMMRDKSDKDLSTDVNEEISVANDYIENDDNIKALEHAKKAIDLNPDDMDLIITVADFAKDIDPGESMQLYGRALKLLKEQDNPDEDGKSAAVYWSAGVLAEQSGSTSQAKVYYQKAIDAADPLSGGDADIITKAEMALENMQ